ncbi:hypothetical protein Q8A73_020316 [Channa argus]|nr:hypothetical protein Q8A73_020316 [Channa argus]
MSSIEDGTTPYTIQSTTTPSNNSTKVSYGTVLLSVYSVVLLTGTISLSLMIHILKSNSTSITSIAVLNLIFAHFLFLFTVPFRIYYYASGDWNLGFWWCKVVSAMIHIHINIDSNSTVFNYIVSTVIIVGATILTALQANVLRVLYKKYDQGCTSQQEFSAQLKSLFFALIMVVCFIPYHVFRLYYLQHINELESFNEMFLSLTTFNCLDMLTFLGRRTCYGCFPGKTA